MEQTKKGFLSSFLDGLYFNNPVLTLFLGLTLAVLATTRFQTALMVGVLTLFILFFTVLIVSLCHSFLNKVGATILSAILSACFATVTMLLLVAYAPKLIDTENEKAIALLTLVPFISTTSLVLIKGQESLEHPLSDNLGDALGSGIGFLLALVLIAFVRELLATGAITFTAIDGTSSTWTAWSGWTLGILSQPFGGFFLVAIFSGIHLAILEAKKQKASVAKEAK